MSSLGHIERADYAIFADPDAELPDTYNLWNKIKLWKQKNNGIPLIKKKKSLYNDIINAYKNNTRVAKIPAHTSSGGIMLRQCTGEYKNCYKRS